MASTLDPYTQKAEANKYSPQEKISSLHELVKSCSTGMLTTRAEDGSMHSRAMVPTSPHNATQVNLVFIGNNSSHKFEEVQHDSHVNVSFYNTSSTSWASFSGKARISRDQEAIKKHWSSSMGAYFGDLKDGVHKGDVNDPRISIIEVVPDEVRFWVAQKGAVGRAVDIAVSSVTSGTSAPGDLVTLSKAEIQLIQGLQTAQ
ncbi:hypothetical protein CYLTODRAFT_385158 [Cylindrobasidium torrendii FP15055 ss-10]|uniref:General stress protein FMN-binding split barrel domain-containing protein n=1 Tax=Cylindrobasidium torrendii FP15055 ss-10 TaxID=1314674 RepID=A0A0D7BV19_9AGAR|nr:hypothetical protein CYLTODRAFT_385158 [Cylindrobasidium torrendii FP15055 ss-10]